MATPMLSPIHHHPHHTPRNGRHHSTTQSVTGAGAGTGSNRERHLSNQVASLKSRLDESERIKMEHQANAWALNNRIDQLEREASAARTDKEEVNAKLDQTATRINRALSKIFTALGGSDGNIDGDDGTAAQPTSLPITGDIDVVVARLVDDALPLLQRRVVQSTRTLNATKAEMDETQQGVEVAQNLLQQLESDKIEAEHDTKAARERCKSVRLELTGVEEQLVAARSDLANVNDEIDALHSEERTVRSSLDVLKGEVKSKRQEMEEVTRDADQRVHDATVAEAKAQEATDQAYIVREDLLRKEDDLVGLNRELDQYKQGMEADRRSLKLDKAGL
mmetsp:Transcript_753/g.1741  ORF Transcript_753/g.1741 Transcript_753/m.1741 type:complete len:336 (+) Transcript_753:413-1420(+)